MVTLVLLIVCACACVLLLANHLSLFRQVLVCELEQQARLSAVPTILSPVDEDNDAGGVDLLGAL